ESENSLLLIAGSRTVTVTHCLLREGMTDGILIVPDAAHTVNLNVWILENRIFANRRNNISGTGQFGLHILSNRIENAGSLQGTAPRSGIDIEPYDLLGQPSNDVHIERNTVTGSQGTYAISCGGLGTN